jgi:hypothetical protein
MIKKIIFLLLAFALTMIIVVSRIVPFALNTHLYYFSAWGIYFFILPAFSLVVSALSPKTVLYKTLIFTTIGILLGIVLTTGNWIENYVFEKIIASILGSIFSVLIIKKNRF